MDVDGRHRSRARPSAPVRTRRPRMCIELLLELADEGRASGNARRPRHRLRRARDRRGQARLGPGARGRQRARRARGGGRERGGERRRARARAGSTCGRAGPPLGRRPWSPTSPRRCYVEFAAKLGPVEWLDPRHLSARGSSPRQGPDVEAAFAEAGLAVARAPRVGRLGRPAVGAGVSVRDLPIAVFDSGVGGLTVLHEFLVSLPEEDYVYLGDSARFPYGTQRRARPARVRGERNTAFLLDRGAKLLVIACNSATAAGFETAREIAAERGVEVIAVIEPEAEIAAAITASGRVGRAGDPRDRRARRLPAGARAPARRPRDHRGRLGRPRPDHPERLPVRRGRDGDGTRRLRAASGGRRGHGHPRLHALPAGRADAPAVPRPRRAPRHRRPRARGERAAGARGARAPTPTTTPRAPTASSARATSTPSASSAPASCRCPSATSSTSML